MLDSTQPDSGINDYNEIFILDSTSDASTNKLNIINENEELNCTPKTTRRRRPFLSDGCFSETLNSDDCDDLTTHGYYSRIAPKTPRSEPLGLSTRDLQTLLSRRKVTASQLRHSLVFEREKNGFDADTTPKSLPKIDTDDKCSCVKCTIAYHEALIKGITDVNLIMCKKCKLKLLACKCCLRNQRPPSPSSETDTPTLNLSTKLAQMSPTPSETSYFDLENKLFAIKNELLHLNESTNDIFEFMLKLSGKINELKSTKSLDDETHYENDNDYELDSKTLEEEDDEDLYDPLAFIDDASGDERHVPVAEDEVDNLYQCIDDDNMSLINEIREALIADEMKSGTTPPMMKSQKTIELEKSAGVSVPKMITSSKLASATNLIISSISNTDSAMCVNSLPKMSSSSSCAASVCMSTLDGLKTSTKSHPKLPVRSNTLNCSPNGTRTLSGNISSSGVSSNSSSSANCSIGTSSSLLSGDKSEIIRRMSMKSDSLSDNRISTTSTLSSNSSCASNSSHLKQTNEQIIYNLISGGEGVGRRTSALVATPTSQKRGEPDSASTSSSTLVQSSRLSSNRNPSFRLEGAIFNRVQNMSLTNKNKILFENSNKSAKDETKPVQQQKVAGKVAKLPIYLMRESANMVSLDSGIYVPSEYEDSFKSSS